MQEENKTEDASSKTAPSVTPDPIATPASGSTDPSGNTSGQGSSASVPEEVKGWSWGAFLLTWIWAIGNSVWIGLLALVPYVGFIMSIVLGIKGREWAWQAKRWDSVKHFNKVQRNWAIAGLILLVVVIAITILITIAVIGFSSEIQSDYY